MSDLERREYPQTWLLLDVVDREPRLVSREVVDLSPGAIELRHVARDLRERADEREHWVRVDERSRWARLEASQRRELSFGPQVGYCVEHDDTRRIHDGRPIRHLIMRFGSRVVGPATSAEIGLYFYGRRPATFGYVNENRAHGFIGFEWEPLDRDDIRWLLRRELGEAGD